ncbi:hypothetical protein WA158_008498 [Blastocystis sp. Blastoise]
MSQDFTNNTNNDPMQFQDALEYMNTIRNRFADESDKYEQFLKIMVDAKSKSCNKKLVIQQISKLFEGHNDLISKFHMFLPDDVPVTPPEPIYVQQEMAPQPTAEYQVAVDFVTRIKERCQNDGQNTYKEFLNILQEYQHGTKSLEVVINEVVTLFKGHQDIIKDFILFLPEKAQAEASHLLSAITYQRMAESNSVVIQPNNMMNSMSDMDHMDMMDTKIKRESKDNLKRNKPYNTIIDTKNRKRIRKNDYSPTITMIKETTNEEKLSTLDRRTFQKIRNEAKTQANYNFFLKLVDLFVKRIISMSELIILIGDSFGWRSSILEIFKELLAEKGIQESSILPSALATHTYTELPEHKLNEFPVATKSYRMIPSHILRPICSNRTEEEKRILNDDLISLPVGSEDFGFNLMRKNQYEEALFRCEDDRYEVDIIIENNRSCILTLTQLLRELETLQKDKPSSDYQYHLKRESLSTLNLKAIQRIYIHEPVYKQIIEFLYMSPLTTIPLLLERMKAKDEEWTRQKNIKEIVWKDIQQKNYYKSLDHLSFYFKQDDKKQMNMKNMIEHIKDVAFKANNIKDTLHTHMTPLDETESHVTSTFKEPTIHKDMYFILYNIAKKNLSHNEMSFFTRYYEYLILNFMSLPHDYMHATKSDYNSSIYLVAGSSVITPQGEGTITSYDVNTDMYTVHLNIEDSVLSPSSLSASHTIVRIPRTDITLKEPENTSSDDESDIEIEKDMDISMSPMASLQEKEKEKEKEKNKETNTNNTNNTNNNNNIINNNNNHDDEDENDVDSIPVNIKLDEEKPSNSNHIMFGSCSLYCFYHLYSILYERLHDALNNCSTTTYTEKDMVQHPVRRNLERMENEKEIIENNVVSDAASDALNKETEELFATGDASHDSDKENSITMDIINDDNHDNSNKDNTTTTTTTTTTVSNNTIIVTDTINDKSNSEGSHTVSNEDTITPTIDNTNNNNNESTPSSNDDKKTVDPLFKYQQLVNSIIHYSRGEIDSNQFEDECRSILGTNAYILFTIDKLCNNIIKYLHGFMSEDSFVIGKAIYDYYTASEVHPSLSLYRNNAICAFRECRTELVRIEFENYPEGEYKQGSEASLHIWYIGKEQDLMHNTIYKNTIKSALFKNFEDYYISSTENEQNPELLASSAGTPFLVRTKKPFNEEQVDVNNGMDIEIENNQVSYTRDEEDSVIRRKRSSITSESNMDTIKSEDSDDSKDDTDNETSIEIDQSEAV